MLFVFLFFYGVSNWSMVVYSCSVVLLRLFVFPSYFSYFFYVCSVMFSGLKSAWCPLTRQKTGRQKTCFTNNRH